MPDRRRHRGPHPADRELFAPAALAALRQAAGDLSWLLSRGYSPVAAATLVGDHFRLTVRQRQAVQRAACADAALAWRQAHCVPPGAIAGQELDIDGFNLLMTIEAALGGAVVLVCRDGCCRDLASMHGSYRRVDESLPALTAIGESLAELRAGACRWLFDRPVSNSGRIGQLAAALAEARSWPWRFELCASPDAVLRASPRIVVSADSAVLDGCQRWFNLAAWVLQRAAPGAWRVDLR